MVLHVVIVLLEYLTEYFIRVSQFCFQTFKRGVTLEPDSCSYLVIIIHHS